MSVTESELAATPAEPTASQADSPWQLVVVAIGWWLLATAGVSFVIEFLGVFFTKVPLGLDQDKWPPSARVLQADLISLGMCGVFLLSARAGGRKIGHGQVRPGIGDNAMANPTMIVVITFVAAAYAIFLRYSLDQNASIFPSSAPIAPWLNAFTIFLIVILAPVSEELFFRGWLWTGLQRHWGFWPTAAVTSVLWLVGHVANGLWQPILLIPVAAALALARQLGRSVRAPIAIHVIYNFFAIVSVIPGAPASTQLEKEYAQCANLNKTFSLDLAISGCTTIIQSSGLKNSDLATAYINRAGAYANKGDSDRAIADAGKAIEIDPKLAMAYNNRAGAHLYRRDFNHAVDDATIAIEIDPKLALAYNHRAAAYVGKGSFDRAITDATKAIETDPKFAMAYNNRAAAYAGKGDFDRAIADATAAIEINPKLASAYNNRASAHIVKGDFDEAIADLTKAIEIDPKLAMVYNNRAGAYVKKGNFDRAIADATAAIEINPKLASAYSNRALAHANKGDLDRAIADFDQAIALNPSFVAAFVGRAEAHDLKMDYDRAIADYSTAIRLDPNNIRLYRVRGYANVHSGNYRAAAVDLARAVQEQPDNAYPVLWLYLARTRSGGQDATLELASNAAKLKPAEWPYAVAELFLDRRTPEATLAAAGKPDERCEAQFYKGVWHILRGDRAAAIEPLRAASSTCPKTFIEYAGAQAELKRLGQ